MTERHVGGLPPASSRPVWLAVALLVASLLVFWPGVVTYDGVQQYHQALSGRYDDWHPPVMARLWALLLPLGSGAGSMLLLQLCAYWLGLAALARAIGGRRAIGILAIGAFPPFLGWQVVVLKDAQMAGALLLATGLLASHRLRDPPLSAPQSTPRLIAAGLCLAYATLVRANAAFSTIPLALLLLAPPRLPIAARVALMPLGIVAAIMVSQFVNHDLIHARDSGVQRSEAIYDLAAIAVRSGDAAAVGLRPADVATLTRERCVVPLFWDRLSARPACAQAIAPLNRESPRQLYVTLAGAALSHPAAYLGHRLSHLNATGRWLVGLHAPFGAPPAYSEPNRLGLASPSSRLARGWQAFAALITETPLAWPIVWTIAGLWGLWMAATRRPDRRQAFATALLVSALVQEASFAALSISSDLRYHLWPMLAIALAWVILWEKGAIAGRRVMPILLGLVIAAGLVARLVLPAAPETYAALIA